MLTRHVRWSPQLCVWLSVCIMSPLRSYQGSKHCVVLQNPNRVSRDDLQENARYCFLPSSLFSSPLRPRLSVPQRLQPGFHCLHWSTDGTKLVINIWIRGVDCIFGSLSLASTLSRKHQCNHQENGEICYRACVIWQTAICCLCHCWILYSLSSPLSITRTLTAPLFMNTLQLFHPLSLSHHTLSTYLP